MAECKTAVSPAFCALITKNCVYKLVQYKWSIHLKPQPRWSWCSLNISSLPTAPVRFPDSKVHGANMGPTWVLSAPGGPHVVPMNLAIRVPFPITAAALLPPYNKPFHTGLMILGMHIAQNLGAQDATLLWHLVCSHYYSQACWASSSTQRYLMMI